MIALEHTGGGRQSAAPMNRAKAELQLAGLSSANQQPRSTAFRENKRCSCLPISSPAGCHPFKSQNLPGKAKAQGDQVCGEPICVSQLCELVFSELVFTANLHSDFSLRAVTLSSTQALTETRAVAVDNTGLS